MFGLIVKAIGTSLLSRTVIFRNILILLLIISFGIILYLERVKANLMKEEERLKLENQKLKVENEILNRKIKEIIKLKKIETKQLKDRNTLCEKLFLENEKIRKQEKEEIEKFLKSLK
jgi:biopolymer transport protein ExbB/TolQ